MVLEAAEKKGKGREVSWRAFHQLNVAALAFLEIRGAGWQVDVWL